MNDSSKDPDLQRLFEKELLGQLHEENMRLARATKKQKEKHRDRRGRLQRLQRHLRERSPMSLEYEFWIHVVEGWSEADGNFPVDRNRHPIWWRS